MVELAEPTQESVEQLKAVTTLRSGKQVEKTIVPRVLPRAALPIEEEVEGEVKKRVAEKVEMSEEKCACSI